MKQDELKEATEKLQDKVDKMGFKGQNEYDLHLREEIALFINHLLSKKPSVSDEEKADELREGERKIKDFEYCSNCLTIEVCRHARECKIQTKE